LYKKISEGSAIFEESMIPLMFIEFGYKRIGWDGDTVDFSTDKLCFVTDSSVDKFILSLTHQ